MLVGIEVTVLIYVMMAGFFRFIFSFSKQAALVFLILANVALIFIMNQLLLFYIFAQFGWVLLLFELTKRFPKRAVLISWLTFVGLIPFNLELWLGESQLVSTVREVGQGGNVVLTLWTVGAAFFVVKSFLALREAMREKKFHYLSTMAGLTFIPALPAGPIFGSMNFRVERIAEKMKYVDTLRNVFMLGWGIAAFYIIAPFVRDLADNNSTDTIGFISDVYLRLAALFFDFSGYTVMAVAFASFFGVTLPQNFNRPYMATSIQKFWQRWHMTLNQFVGMYLFKPFVRNTGSPRLGIFLAFFIVGLWHEFSLNYLLWGMGHGVALSLAMKPPRLYLAVVNKIPWVGKIVGWFLTMTYVSFLSYMASGYLWGTI